MWATLAAQVAGVPTESDCGVVVWPEKARATVAIGSAAVVVVVVAAAAHPRVWEEHQHCKDTRHLRLEGSRNQQSAFCMMSLKKKRRRVPLLPPYALALVRRRVSSLVWPR